MRSVWSLRGTYAGVMDTSSGCPRTASGRDRRVCRRVGMDKGGSRKGGDRRTCSG